MKHSATGKRFVGIVLAFILTAAPAAAQRHLAITPVTVIDTTDGTLHREQAVLVVGNRIAFVGPAHEARIPDGAEVVDGTGRYLIPGLWDMHVHSVEPVTIDEAGPSIARQDWHFPLFLAYGITGVRNMNNFTGDVTLELSRRIKRRLSEGSRPGPPRFLTAGPSIDGEPPLGGSKKVVVRTAAEARSVAKDLATNGADLIKVYENVSREAYFAIMDEARLRNIPVDGHLPFRITPQEAAAAGQRTLEHPEALAAGCSTAAGAERKRFASVLADFGNLPDSEKFLVQFRHYRALYDSRDPDACAAAFEAYRENGVAVTVDLLGYHHVVHAREILADADRLQLVPEAIRRGWEDLVDSGMTREFQSILRSIPPLELENVRLANEAGVMLLAGTDVGVPLQVPGFSLHEELARLVEAGLTPLEALQTTTLNPSLVLDMTDSLGTVEVGKLADLVLLDANPLEDIHNTRKIRAVVADGRLYRRADLDRLVAEAASLREQGTDLGGPVPEKPAMAIVRSAFRIQPMEEP